MNCYDHYDKIRIVPFKTESSVTSGSSSPGTITPPTLSPIESYSMLDFQQHQCQQPPGAGRLSFFGVSAHQPFVLGSPPLAALHSMAEMRHSGAGSPGSGKASPAGSSHTSASTGSQGAGGGSSGGTTAGHHSSTASNPHGIDHILSRPANVNASGAALGALHGE